MLNMYLNLDLYEAEKAVPAADGFYPCITFDGMMTMVEYDIDLHCFDVSNSVYSVRYWADQGSDLERLIRKLAIGEDREDV